MDCKTIIKSDLARSENSTYVIQIALNIIEFFEAHDPKHYSSLSASSFTEKIPLASSYPNELLRALTYLSIGQVHLFDMQFKFFDETEKRYFNILPAEIDDAYKTDVLIHPNTGAEIRDFEDKISVIYKPTNIALDIFEDGRSARSHS